VARLDHGGTAEDAQIVRGDLKNARSNKGGISGDARRRRNNRTWMENRG